MIKELTQSKAQPRIGSPKVDISQVEGSYFLAIVPAFVKS